MRDPDHLSQIGRSILGLQREVDTIRNLIRSRTRAGRNAGELRRDPEAKVAKLTTLLLERNAALISQRKASLDDR
jgi:hypothetical protein